MTAIIALEEYNGVAKKAQYEKLSAAQMTTAAITIQNFDRSTLNRSFISSFFIFISVPTTTFGIIVFICISPIVPRVYVVLRAALDRIGLAYPLRTG